MDFVTEKKGEDKVKTLSTFKPEPFCGRGLESINYVYFL
jgi:hypothetical protein